jgi:membrane protein
MGAAIAYNSLFAMVPLAIALIAILTLFDVTDEVLAELSMWMTDNLTPDTAAFITELVTESVGWFNSSRGVILVLSLLVALWSGSRAVYAVQKALRTVEGVEDTRGYIVSRSLGIGVTVVAGIGVLVAYIVAAAGELLWQWVEDQAGVGTAAAAQITLLLVAIAWGWGLLWVIYRWGPPQPVPRSGLISAIVAALLVLGSYLAFEVVATNSSALAVFGTIGVLLVWLYYIGIVVVGAPTVIDALIVAATKQVRG